MKAKKLRRPAAMTAWHRRKRVPAMRITAEKQDAEEAVALIDRKLEVVQARQAKRRAVIAALRKATSYWTPPKLLALSRSDSKDVAYFLQKANQALAGFRTNPDKDDTRIRDFMPLATMRYHYREAVKLCEVSELLALPIEEVRQLMRHPVHPLPSFIARLHPEYKD